MILSVNNFNELKYKNCHCKLISILTYPLNERISFFPPLKHPLFPFRISHSIMFKLWSHIPKKVLRIHLVWLSRSKSSFSHYPHETSFSPYTRQEYVENANEILHQLSFEDGHTNEHFFQDKLQRIPSSLKGKKKAFGSPSRFSNFSSAKHPWISLNKYIVHRFPWVKISKVEENKPFSDSKSSILLQLK